MKNRSKVEQLPVGKWILLGLPITKGFAQMTLDEYQTWQQTMAFYPQVGEFEGLVYTVLALGGEAGEVQNELKKVIRDKGGLLTVQTKKALGLELGDVLWYISAASKELGFTLQQIAEFNQSKLEKRHSDGGKVG